ncbi:lantibiotic immunity ABC transporter MutG family permease subunit [Butyrivibrio sp. WCE2006]|uniref:lantibiotic immunity ABC transporter MutG family permease subunit n=1 Tax=Butyrivibrio sp. WCE2006 TaxID=1410611 RepID=UPI0005D17605|nr:lantibiotic immunity ABC transporter MutG family permease subunit [Butyrivibrio sp. WCE2006]
MFSRCLRADFYKMKRNPITIAHIVIPIVVSIVFLAYYATSGWNETDKISAFFEALGSGFPVLIGIFIASTMEQEQNAGAFQNLLTLRSKTAALFSKAVTLILLSLFALLFTAVLFGVGFIIIHGQGTASMGVLLMAAFVMWLSAIPLYLLFDIFAFVFGKAFVIGAGLISGLISALFLTDIGMYAWKVVPLSWTARMPETFLVYELADIGALSEIRSQALIYMAVAIVCLAGYFIFAANYEGSKISE